MRQKFSSPIEEMRFARVHLRGALILVNGFQRIPRFLLDVTKQMMEFGSVLPREQGASMAPRVFILSGVRISDCQFVRVVVIARIQLSSLLQIRDRITRLSVVGQQLSELVICFEACWITLDCVAQRFFCSLRRGGG